MRLLYTTLLYLIQPVIWVRLLLRARKAPAYRKRWAERYGFCQGKVAAGGILLHSVSVGETLAAVPLVRALRQRYPDLPITVTTMTPTGSERVLSAFAQDVYHVYLPYDLPDAINRFLNQVKPKLVVIMETELWPNLIYLLNQRHIPLIIANARLSEKSSRGYRRLGRAMSDIMQKITLIAVQSQDDADRFISLGVKPDHLSVTGSIKFDISVTAEQAAQALTLRQQWAAYRPVWIAASTHDGEEQIILQAQRNLLAQIPTLLLILVPRHPERFPIAEELTRAAGMSYITRSSGKIPTAETQVVIGNTMGELMLLYGVSDLAFVGGSLIEHGGHNPLEPAVHAIPIIMGPHTFNFKDIGDKLERAGGLVRANDALSLTAAVAQLLTDEKLRLEKGRLAVEVLHHNQGALDRLLHLLEPYLPASDH